MKLKDLLKVVFCSQTVAVRIWADDDCVYASEPQFADLFDYHDLLANTPAITFDDFVVLEVFEVDHNIIIQCEIR